MDRLRWIVVMIISGALTGGVFARILFANSDLAERQFEVRQPSDAEGLQVVGVFIEPFTQQAGYEISLPRCSRPLAVVPVSARALSVSPGEYEYRHLGEYAVSYVYNGNVYPEEGIGPRLRLLRMLYRLQSLFGLTDARSFAYYLRLFWIFGG